MQHFAEDIMDHVPTNIGRHVATFSIRKLKILHSVFSLQDGKIPADQITTVNKLQTISFGFFGFFFAAEVLGIVMAVAFLAFNISHSTHR